MKGDVGKLIGPEFLERPTLIVAEELLGQHLCRQVSGQTERYRITELEAYDGTEDKACHAHKGKTPRNTIMFGPAGHWYVYLCYGMHWLLNIVTGTEDYPAAVLFRGIKERRGPGRLTKALQIDKAQNGKPAHPDSGLWIEHSGLSHPEHDIERTPRIGIDYAGEYWAQVPYRFVLKT